MATRFSNPSRGMAALETSSRASGIALLVVIVAFTILYVVVYQLHFSTAMEAKIAKVRYQEVESAISFHSAALHVVQLLIEDLQAGVSQQSASAGGATGGGPGGGAPAGGEGAAGGDYSPLLILDGAGGGGQAATGGVSTWYTYLHQNIFSDNQQQIGDVSVKISVRDGERAFDLNRLFEYARLLGEDVEEGAADIRDEDAIDAAAADQAAEEETLRASILRRVSAARGTGGSDAEGAAAGEGASDAVAAGLEEDDPVAAALGEYEPEAEFLRPAEERIQATREMVERTILMMFSINENEYGYRYSRKYVAGQIADAIVDYVLDRRSQPYQNRIYFVSELLNITDYNGNPLIPPEVYYGPYPEVAEGEEYSPSSGFTLRRDEFGDVVPQYDFLVDDPWLQEQTQALEDLQGQLGRFADFPGLGRLKSNALTRGMQEPPVEIDEYGREYIPDSPTPIGLRDLFTTFSTGKININTAPAPVIFALLLSCSEDEANNVALDLRDYRNRFQEEIDPEGVDRVEDGSATPDLGQPRRVATEEDEEIDPVTGLPYDGLTDATSGYGMGLDGMDPESLVAPYQDLETNYFTDLRQIELIDGTDGGPIDFVRSDEGVERVSEEAGTLYQRVLADLGKVAVFGSTYFEATLKSKAEAGRRGNTGYLVLRRDPKRKKIEVVMWKTLER